MNVRQISTALVVAGLLAAGTAQAVPLTWTLQSVVFDDGGTANGSFVFDADTTSYSNIMINTTAGSVLGAQAYTLLRPGSGTLDFGFTIIDVVEADMTGNQHMAVVFASSLTNAGGTISFGSNGGFDPWEGTCSQADCKMGFIDRNVVSGTVFARAPDSTNPVPEPTGAVVFGVGMLCVAASNRSRRVRR